MLFEGGFGNKVFVSDLGEFLYVHRVKAIKHESDTLLDMLLHTQQTRHLSLKTDIIMGKACFKSHEKVRSR